MARLDLDQLKPLDYCETQPYFSRTLQIADIVEWVLSQTGVAKVTISTFSTSEEFIRRIVRLKAKGLISSATLFCDIRAARKTLNLYEFINSVFDKVYLCENHSKVVLIEAASISVAIVTSQNQTRGDRYECGVISSMESLTSYLSAALANLAQSSRPLYVLLS